MKEREVRAKLVGICRSIDDRRKARGAAIAGAGALLPVLIGLGLAGTACDDDDPYRDRPGEALYGVGGYVTTTSSSSGGTSAGGSGAAGGEAGAGQGGEAQGGGGHGGGQGGSGQGGDGGAAVGGSGGAAGGQ